MKKLLLFSALVAGTLALAQPQKYEISPMIGYNFSEGNLDIKNDGYPVLGVEFQFNPEGSKFSPELSLFYSEGVKYDNSEKTRVLKAAFNGVYTFDTFETFYNITPFAKAGFGASSISNASDSVSSGFFLDTGAGAKIPLSDMFTLKLEMTYIAKLASENAGYTDSNLLTMIGLTFAFGGDTSQKVPELRYPPVFIDGDDDDDTVLNSKDSCPNTPPGIEIDEKGCPADDDNDGVSNLNDDCPQTPLKEVVDMNGCKADKDDDGVLNPIDICPSTPKGIEVDKVGCNIDQDFDGVLNDKDICPDTPLEDSVNEDGCPKTITLKINFKSNSTDITEDSYPQMQIYSKFLKEHTEYSVKIVGYSDSIGRASYNKMLSKKRADSVVRYLISSGVSKAQLSSDGAGEIDPIASNSTAAGRAKNRRIEAELTRK